MTLQEAIKSGKPYKRRNNKVWIDPDNDSAFAMRDILATDWEVKKDDPKEVEFTDGYGDRIRISKGVFSSIYFGINDFEVDVELKNNQIDELLTFLYNNTDIGSKRIIPF